MRGLYIHIPFCKHICNYCDFPKRVARNERQIEEYINFIINDFSKYEKYYHDVKTIYIGGGTPNILSDNLLEKLFNAIQKLNINPIEYTIEINPELLTINQILLFKKYRINRVSIGVETFINDDLVKLNRHHTKEDAIRSVKLLKENGINNINIDLIYAHPFDNMDKVLLNLKEFIKLDVNHISYYSMILEDKTVFNYLINKNELELLDNEIEGKMYEEIIKYLKEHNYHHYETSNFAKIGFESKHNMLYWDACEYIGIGCGASGYLDDLRYTNNFSLKKYYNNEKDIEHLSITDKKNEFMMLGFRKIDGISFDDYQKRFNSTIFDDFNLQKLIDKGLLEFDDLKIRLTPKGQMLANEVFMEFV